VRFGIKTSPQNTTWPDMLAVWQAADGIELFESGWTFDHFYPIFSDPNGQGLPLWRPYDLQSRATLVVSTEDRVACVDDPMGPTREAIAHYKANVSRA